MDHQKVRQATIYFTLLTVLLLACNVVQFQPTLTPTPTLDMTPGQVRGTLLDAYQHPISGVRLGLLRTVRSGGGAEGEVFGETVIKQFVALDGVFVQVVDAGLEALTDTSGVFLFESVPPGEYVPYAMYSQPVPLKDSNGVTLVFTLLPGELVNLSIQQ